MARRTKSAASRVGCPGVRQTTPATCSRPCSRCSPSCLALRGMRSMIVRRDRGWRIKVGTPLSGYLPGSRLLQSHGIGAVSPSLRNIVWKQVSKNVCLRHRYRNFSLSSEGGKKKEAQRETDRERVSPFQGRGSVLKSRAVLMLKTNELTRGERTEPSHHAAPLRSGLFSFFFS